MNAVRWWQRAAGLLMVLFLLTVGWKMRAFIWTAVQNAVVRSWYPVWGTNLRDIPDSEEGKRHRLAGWKKQTQGEADPSYYKYLEDEAWNGYEMRYPAGHINRQKAKPRLEYELGIIKQMNFVY